VGVRDGWKGCYVIVSVGVHDGWKTYVNVSGCVQWVERLLCNCVSGCARWVQDLCKCQWVCAMGGKAVM
jgi:hypothetical protein